MHWSPTRPVVDMAKGGATIGGGAEGGNYPPPISNLSVFTV